MILNKNDKLTTRSIVLVQCDFKVSTKCKKVYKKTYRNVLKSRTLNNEKDRCQYCFNSSTKIGEQNYNFKYPKNESFFEKIDSEIKAYLLGWVAGDGCLKKDGLYLSVHKKDVEICELFLKHLSPQSKIKYRNYDNTANIVINSVQIVRDLCDHLQVDIGKKSDKITLPKMSDNLTWAFIRGLIDSDGTINTTDSKRTTPTCGYCSMSSTIKQQITDFCAKYDIDFYKSGFSIYCCGFNAINFMSAIYDNSSFSLSRKRSLYEYWKNWTPRKKKI